MAKQLTIHINFDSTLEILRRGVRRSDVFMGVGLNASEHNPPVSHLLGQDGQQQIHLVKQELNENEKSHVATEFGKWVQANGLRELLETFSIFAHQLYSIIFLIKQTKKQLDKEFNKCRPEKFDRMGIGVQIKRMSEVVTVSESDVRIIHSLNKMRNCYAHRQGRVGVADLDEGNTTFQVLWSALQLVIREQDGNVVSGNDIIGKVFEKGGAVLLAVREKSKDFVPGAELILEKQELKEICLCVLSIGERLFREPVSVARNAGILQKKVDSNLNDAKPV